MKKKALSDTIIKIVAGASLWVALLKKRRSRPAWSGSIKEMMNDNKGIGGASIFREIKMLATAWYLIQGLFFPV